MSSDDNFAGTQTSTAMREMVADPQDPDLYQVVSLDSKGLRTILGRGLTREQALAWLKGQHPMPGRKIGVLPDTRFNRKLLNDS